MREGVRVLESEGWEADCEKPSLRIVLRGHYSGIGVCMRAACRGSDVPDQGPRLLGKNDQLLTRNELKK